MGVKIFQVDAFTDKPFSGNPAAVCVLTEPRDEGWMQRVAREMNLSETAFLCEQESGFNLRWFTPVVEVDLCGWARGILLPIKPRIEAALCVLESSTIACIWGDERSLS